MKHEATLNRTRWTVILFLFLGYHHYRCRSLISGARVEAIRPAADRDAR